MPHFSSYDGARLGYHLLGGSPPGRERPPVVCLAGGPARDAAYLGDLGGLGAYRQLVVPDARGTGDSPAASDPDEYAFPRLAEDVEALRRHLGLDRFALLAHDAAAATAQTYAAAHPGRLTHLVLLNPGSRLQGELPDDAREIFNSRAEEGEWWAEAHTAVQLLEQATDLDEIRTLLHRAAPMAYARWEAPQRAHAAAEGDQLNPVPRAGFWQGVDEPSRRSVLDALHRVEAPVLVVTGDLDAVTGMRAGEAVAESFPNARLHTLKDTGHYPWVDSPGSLTRLLQDFLQA
ncbi:translation initiation factor IF-2 [Streptomyces abyssalis]|uniref:Translation initiation factor IF-2 n=1 Tax=Streptomyces abyssalis TaxID=933944 RepID=A0A1E7JJA5_9ACTN|nr:alpha/beta hydrolase [Streptomyces abyssalis]OEU87202.1 translation initiation factor IF-2 [Streptomyces abyssalis]OEU87736.1 translation initiation factor IF-2 [Streptomyces abyssalis]